MHQLFILSIQTDHGNLFQMICKCSRLTFATKNSANHIDALEHTNDCIDTVILLQRGAEYLRYHKVLVSHLIL